jgi:prevent-host-death family protein
MARRKADGARVTATDAAKNFGELVDRVREAGTDYVVERKGRPIARISPIVTRRCTMGELVAWLESRREPPDDYAAAVNDYLRAANRPRRPAARWQP